MMTVTPSASQESTKFGVGNVGLLLLSTVFLCKYLMSLLPVASNQEKQIALLVWVRNIQYKSEFAAQKRTKYTLK